MFLPCTRADHSSLGQHRSSRLLHGAEIVESWSPIRALRRWSIVSTGFLLIAGVAHAQGLSPVMAVEPSDLDFGVVPIGQPASATINVSNGASDPRSLLIVTALEIVGQRFAIQSALTLPDTIPGDGSALSVILGISPDSMGVATGQCRIIGNGIGSPFVVPLRASVVSSSDGGLVWSVRLEDDRAQLEANEFERGGVFPLEHVRVTRVERSFETINGHPRVNVTKMIAPLFVNGNGTLRSDSLAFFSGSSVSRAWELFTVLANRGSVEDRDERPLGSVSVLEINLLESQHEEIDGWQTLRDGYSLVNTSLRTVIVPGDASGLPHVYQYRTSDVVVARDANRIALVARDGRRSRLVVLRSDGGIVLEKPFEGRDFSQLYLTSSASRLVYQQSSGNDGTETRVLDIGSDASTTIAVEQGIRFHSDDGTRMMVVQTGLKTAFLYDTNDWLSPILLATYRADDVITTGAVCDDGSLVALQILNQDRNANRKQRRVVVLDEAMTEIAHPIQSSDRDETEGLQWAGKHLIVGVQEHPLPVPIHWTDTKRVRIFSFTSRERGK